MNNARYTDHTGRILGSDNVVLPLGGCAGIDHLLFDCGSCSRLIGSWVFAGMRFIEAWNLKGRSFGEPSYCIESFVDCGLGNQLLFQPVFSRKVHHCQADKNSECALTGQYKQCNAQEDKQEAK